MYTINTIPMTDYGLHISKQDGSVHLLEPKEQFFTAYGKQGYQVTKHKANELDLSGFIVADDLTDFQTKTTALYGVFSGPGIKAVALEASAINCFAKDGYTITKVRVFSNAVYAQFNIKLTIV